MTVGAPVGMGKDEVTALVQAEVAASAGPVLPFSQVTLSDVLESQVFLDAFGLPPYTEGKLIGTLTITPTKNTAKILIEVSAWGDIYGDEGFFAVLFKGTTPISVGSFGGVKRAKGMQALTMTHYDSPATTSPVTYNLRAGSENGAKWNINRTMSWNEFGGGVSLKSKMYARQI